MCSKKCADIFGKILQVLLIIMLVVYIISLIVDISVKSMILLVILIIIYVLYIIAEFCSPICSFLCHKTTENGIQIQYGNLIQTPPVIEFYCECYHYEVRTVRYNPPKKGGKGGKRSGGVKKSGGAKKTGVSRGVSQGRGRATGTRVRQERRRVTTWRETVTFPYYSARDVSGLFELKKSREEAMGKTYIKLELTPEINFADSISYMDYETFRTDFYNRNRPRDQYMDYRETRKIPGLNQYNFVCIRNEEPCGVNICLYILLTIIPLVELYKCYVNSYCLEQKFTIRKLISTRYDLNQNQQYQVFTPSINVPSQQYIFDQNNYNYLNTQYQVQTPTNEELNRANQYNNMIPNYQCVSYTSFNNGQIKVGVVQDDPSYCSRNINEAAPPNCQDIGPEPNQMNNNLNMNMNMNMGQNNMNMVQNNMNMGQNNINMGSNNMYMNAPLDSRNNLNNNMYNNLNNNNMYNNNFNNNMNGDDDSEDENGGNAAYPYQGY